MSRSYLLLAAAVAAGATAAPVCQDAASCKRALSAVLPSAAAAHPIFASLLNAKTTATRVLPPVTGPNSPAQWCPNASAYEFFPAQLLVAPPPPYTAPLVSSGPGVCFNSITFAANLTSTALHVTITGTNATGLLCDDLLLVANDYDLALAVISPLAPTATVTIPLDAAGTTSIDLNGFAVFVGPCGVVGTIASVAATVATFVGANLSAVNTAFLTDVGVWPLPLVPFNRTTALPASAIKSGDYLAIARFDGLDPLIMYGTGSLTGHSAIAVWKGDVLHVSESTDKNPFGAVYWPPPYGIITHPYDEWVTLAVQAGYHVSVLPIADEYAAAFNETAFWNWFDTVQGLPYGYHTMLYSFLDTYAPFANLPEPITAPLLSPLMNALDAILGNGTEGVTAYSMITQGLNKRLGTNCTSVACTVDAILANKAAKRPLSSFAEAVAAVDEDAWVFGGNYSMVCSEFAAHGWKAGLQGAFDVFAAIQANEQTPKDNYQLNMYNPSRWTSADCPGGLVTRPGGTYCQLMGAYAMYLNDYNTVPVYAGVNNHCPAQWPSYQRCPAGNPSCC